MQICQRFVQHYSICWDVSLTAALICVGNAEFLKVLSCVTSNFPGTFLVCYLYINDWNGSSEPGPKIFLLVVISLLQLVGRASQDEHLTEL